MAGFLASPYLLLVGAIAMFLFIAGVAVLDEYRDWQIGRRWRDPMADAIASVDAAFEKAEREMRRIAREHHKF